MKTQETITQIADVHRCDLCDTKLMTVGNVPGERTVHYVPRVMTARRHSFQPWGLALAGADNEILLEADGDCYECEGTSEIVTKMELCQPCAHAVATVMQGIADANRGSVTQ